jgi:hypothetical protein
MRMRTILIFVLALGATTCSVLANGPTTKPGGSPLMAFVLISQVIKQNPTATQAQLNDAFMAEADSIVTRAHSVGCTRSIVWDESCDDYQDFQYVGEPRLIHPKFAPVAKQFFKRIHDAGIDTGVAAREGVMIRDAVTGKLDYARPLSPVWSVMGKAMWARDNYGASWFYWDSSIDGNGDPSLSGPLSMLHQAMPVARFILEFVYGSVVWVCYGRWCDPRFEKPIPNDGFTKLIGCMDQWDDSRAQEFRDAAARGDILMYAGWWDAPWNAGLFKALGIVPK